MPSKRTKSPVPFGMSTKQMKRKKPINSDLMRVVEPLTKNQEELFRCYKNDQNIVAYGAAGTGKTFITLYNALRDVFDFKTVTGIPEDIRNELIEVSKSHKKLNKQHLTQDFYISNREIAQAHILYIGMVVQKLILLNLIDYLLIGLTNLL